MAGKNLKHMKSNSNTYAVEIGLQFANYYVSPSSLSKKKEKKEMKILKQILPR